MTVTDSTANDDDPTADPGDVERIPAREMRGEDWAAQIGQRFAIHLPEDLVSWFDDELWNSLGPGEYRHPATPKSLLSEVPDAVWPPLMPPNFLPLVGNGAGDWLCLRLIDPDVAKSTGQSTDVCHWYHGGGDWLPWGKSLAEALLFDWVLPDLPQPDRRHADPAENLSDRTTDDENSTRRPTDHPWVRWANSYVPSLADPEPDGDSIAHQLLRQGICEIPVRCQLAIDALDNRLLNRLDPKLANQLEIPWNDLMSWCFDLQTLPEDTATVLKQRLELSDAVLAPCQQQWAEVEEHAQAIAQRASDLSWAHDLLGYCRLRRGDSHGAAAAFGQAIRCSVFTDQSVRFRTHWATSSDGVAKFAACFLSDLPELADVENQHQDQLGCVPHAIDVGKMVELLGRQNGDTRDRVRATYSSWLLDQTKTNAGQCPKTSARLIYAAGWDLGAEPLKSFGQLLDQYIAACRDAGWESHQRLAAVHRQGLKARYNL